MSAEQVLPVVEKAPVRQKTAEEIITAITLARYHAKRVSPEVASQGVHAVATPVVRDGYQVTGA